VMHALANLMRLDPTQSPKVEQASLIHENMTDLSHELRAYLETLEFNPKRLDQVEERLGLIATLKRKYGEDIKAILAFGEQAHRQMEAITHAGERIQELETEEARLLEQISKDGFALSKERHHQAERMGRAIESELRDLQMSGTRFEVDFQTRLDPHGALWEGGQRVAFDSSGLERLEFLIEPNPGEGLKPMVKIASGGETSRLMLALKNVLTSADRIPTLIFDEIDQGIGGRVGAVVGQKLWQLALKHQVVCVTHLPQLAAYGVQHFHVEKLIQAGRTVTRVRQLTGDSRLNELALMMGEISNGTLQSAREILDSVSRLTKA